MSNTKWVVVVYLDPYWKKPRRQSVSYVTADSRSAAERQVLDGLSSGDFDQISTMEQSYYKQNR